MQALSVYLGGNKICTAGEKSGGVSAGVNLTSGPPRVHCYLNVGGFVGDTNDFLKWCLQELKVGDEIRIVIEEVDQPDEPKERMSAAEVNRRARNLGLEDRPEEISDDELKPPPPPVVLEVLKRLDSGDRNVIEHLIYSVRKRNKDGRLTGIEGQWANAQEESLRVKMQALSIYLGDDKICTAGVTDGSISVDIRLFTGLRWEEGFLSIRGIDGDSGDSVSWCRRKDLDDGDEIRIVVEEVGKADEPHERKSAAKVNRRAQNPGLKDGSKSKSGNPLQPLPVPIAFEVLERLEPKDREVIKDFLRSLRTPAGGDRS